MPCGRLGGVRQDIRRIEAFRTGWWRRRRGPGDVKLKSFAKYNIILCSVHVKLNYKWSGYDDNYDTDDTRTLIRDVNEQKKNIIYISLNIKWAINSVILFILHVSRLSVSFKLKITYIYW